jgi:BASS family bile acid:Na+ symporter
MLVQLFLPFTIAMILLSLGLGLTTADFRRIGAQPRAVAVGAVGQLLLLPALGFAAAFALDLRPELAVGLVLITACPGGAHSNLFSNLARGDTALSVSLTALSGLATIATIPLLMGLAAAAFGEGRVVAPPLLETTGQLIAVVAVPLALGMVVRSRWPRVARFGERIIKALAFGLLLLIVVGAVSKQWSEVVAFAAEVGLAVVAVHLLALLGGGVLALAGRLPPRQQITVVLEVGVQNSALAVGLAMGPMNSTDIAVPAIVYSLLVYVTAAVIVTAGRLRLPAVQG